jgi:hypothetical protein
MSDIPADIMKSAEEALDNLLCNCKESCGGSAGLRLASITEIAKAIYGERLKLEEVGFVEKAGDHLNISIDDDLTWAEGEKLYRKVSE